MDYSFNYPTEWHNGILVKCNECKLKIFENIQKNEKINFNEKNRDAAIYFIVETLHESFEDYHKYPLRTKRNVLEILTKHGQFSEDVIEKVYNSVQVSTEWNEEWEEYTKQMGFSDHDIAEYTFCQHCGGVPKIKIDDPIDFHFGYRCCDTENEIGICSQKIEEFTCPDCHIKFGNCPDNVNWYGDLVCPSCQKPIMKSGIPLSHGTWEKTVTQPLLKHLGCDYLAIFHNNCKKSPSGKGNMYPIGLWVDGARLIIHLKCAYCGYEDVLKHLVRSKSFLDHVYTHDESRKFAKLKKIKYRTFDLLSGTESKTLEFKSSFYGINTVEPPTPKSIKSANKKIIKEILGFLNSEGGSLLIGIEKTKNICGMERDFNYIKKEKTSQLTPPDQFTLDFKELLLSEIADYGCALPNINLSLENLPIGKTVCIIDVEKSSSPIFDKDHKLIVNAIGATRTLEESEVHDYIRTHFK